MTKMDTTQMVTEVYSAEVDDRRAVEVFLDNHGEYWVGLTLIRDPKDWEFHPKEQYGVGETGERLAVDAANRWASGLRLDARWMALR